ncbi:type II toxin-antitoxin system VapC family toxin [Thermacetogenium phaeum]|uniref:type II toxin-antitoxin system VapC family toxin n=1 Tax=Thermacetogenium phaeum TaxID=85874 RepID=UPI0009DDF604|nr:PIN domain-containing protein [Thermacetogenium phaeum]
MIKMLKRAIRGALLDTDFLIDLNRSKRNQWRQRAEKLLHDINSEELFISSVTVIEFLTGIPENKQAEAQNMLEELYYYATPTYKEAALAGRFRRDWLAKGYTLSVADVVNAAIAISRNLTLVTRNLAHYPFDQLTILSW